MSSLKRQIRRSCPPESRSPSSSKIKERLQQQQEWREEQLRFLPGGDLDVEGGDVPQTPPPARIRGDPIRVDAPDANDGDDHDDDDDLPKVISHVTPENGSKEIDLTSLIKDKQHFVAPTVSDEPFIRTHPVFLLALAFLNTLLTSGVIFGWAALVPALVQNGVFSSMCDRDNQPAIPAGSGAITLCLLQDGMLQLSFTIAAVALYLSHIPFTWLLDLYGPCATSIVAAVVFAAGLMVCAICDGFSVTIGMGLLGLGGPGIQMAVSPFTGFYPQYRSYLVQLLTVAFDMSTFLFAAFAAASANYQIPVGELFLWLLFIPGFIIVTSVMFFPRAVRQEKVVPSKGRTGGQSCCAQSFSIPFWFISLFAATHMLKVNFLVATLSSQLSYTHDAANIPFFVTVFSAILPLAFVAGPIGSWVVSTRGFSFGVYLITAVSFCYSFVFIFLDSSSDDVLCTLGLGALGVSRQLVFALVYEFHGAEFGATHFGTLIGLTYFFVAAATGSIPIISAFTLSEWGHTAHPYLAANTVLLLAVLPFLFVPMVLTGDKPMCGSAAVAPAAAKSSQKRKGGGSSRRRRADSEDEPDDSGDDEDRQIRSTRRGGGSRHSRRGAEDDDDDDGDDAPPSPRTSRSSRSRTPRS